MPHLRLTKGFDRLSDPGLLRMATGIYEQVSKHTDSFPAPEPTMPELLQAINAFADATAFVATGGSRSAFYQKNELKAALVSELYNLCCYVLFKAKGNRTVALQSGFSIAREGEPVVLQKPAAPSLTVTGVSGQLVLTTGKIPGARIYLHQYSTDPALNEESWATVECTTIKCMLKGLKPGTNYYFRVGIVGAKAQRLFSDVSSRVAA